MVYHIKGNPESKYKFVKKDVESIIFLSRLLSTAERNYGSTEFEVAGLCWVIKKIRYLVEATIV